MQEIDFLPTRYREKNALRKTRLWQLVLFLLVTLAVGASTTGQYALRRSVDRDLLAIESRHQTALARHAELANLRQELDQANEVAALYTYLKHPWPRTQLIAEIVTRLPSAIVLDGLTIGTNRPARAAPPRSSLQKDPSDLQLPRQRRDLNELRGEIDSQKSIVELSGRARDVVQLHQYVARLGQSPLFESAKLDSLESRPEDGSATFLVRLVITPGFGQPGGPTAPLDDHAHRIARGELSR